MITTAEIHTAIYDRMLTLDPTQTIVWPGLFPVTVSSPNPPFVHVHGEPTVVRDVTVKGGLEEHEGFIFASVMTARNIGEFPGLTIAQSIKVLFPRGLRITTDNGEICITQPPFIMMGRQDGPHWRTDVKINYEAS